MKSHTVPKKLLENFAYDDPVTHSKRLWRYQKGRRPFGEAAPRTATRWDGHFADPANSVKEAELEERLKREFEDPVNQFIDMVGCTTFPWTATQIRLLTGYMTILFHRTRARRTMSDIQKRIMLEALRALRSNDDRLSQLVAKQTMDPINGGHLPPQVFTKEQVVEAIDREIAKHTNIDEAQRLYIQTMETMMAFSDENMLKGRWDIIHTEPNRPFVIGDAPVVTWERTENNVRVYGQGFARPNVEVFLPVCPTACIHVSPLVERTRRVRTPVTEEVNKAQAAFATEHCFTNLCSLDIDATLQPEFGKVPLGVSGFSVEHIDFNKALFDILMGQRS